MDILRIVTLSLIGIAFLIIIFVPMAEERIISFLRKNNVPKAFIYMLKSGAKGVYFIRVDIYIDTKYQITDFEFINGEIRIEENTIPLSKNVIDVTISINRSLNWVYREVKGKKSFFKLNDPIRSDKIDEKDFRYNDNVDSSTNRYVCSFSKDLEDSEIAHVFSHNKKNRDTTLYLKYETEIQNEKTITEISEDFNLVMKKKRYSLLMIAFYMILHKLGLIRGLKDSKN